MNTPRSPILTLFSEAIECASPEAQAAYLDRACDPALRPEVEGLLRAHREAGQFLQGRPCPVNGTTATATPTAQPGERPGSQVGPYRLLEAIGEGGFAVVFMAEQHHPVRRRVAIKVLKPGMDSKQIIARFEAEWQALAWMDHPNIARVLDAGVAESGRPYFVMELIRGIPITDYCDRHAVTPRGRLELFLAVCHAVQHAHQKGIIHRDLKPSNVLVTLHDGAPVIKVIDFGIAKAIGRPLTERTLFTNFAQMVGTPLYMSPEQAELSGLDVDTRTDIYSLGVLLYELLTSTTPFDRERLRTAAFDEIRRIIREEEPPRPSTRLSTLGDALTEVSAHRGTDPRRIGPLVRGELDWIVMKALEKDRRRRYESAGTFASDVRHYLDCEPVEACPPSMLYRFRKLARRHRAGLGAVAAVGVVLLAGSLVSAWLAVRATRAEALARTWLAAERIERERAVRRLFDARLAQARASRYSGRLGRRQESWTAIVEAAELAREQGLGELNRLELRNEAIACLALADLRPVRQWPGLPRGSAAGWAFDLDLEHYARSDLKGAVRVFRAGDDRPLGRLPAQGSGAAFLRFSPRGDLLAIRYWHPFPDGPGNVQVWDWRRGRVVFRTESRCHRAALAFSPDGRHLALGEADGTISVHEADTGVALGGFDAGFPPLHLAFHPDGSRLAVAHSQRGEVQVRELADGRLVHRWPTQGVVRETAWHPDGTLLAAACDDAQVYLLNAATGRQDAVLQGHQNVVVGVAFAPASDQLLSWAWDGTTRLWDPWTGREVIRFAGGDPAFSRDGTRLGSRHGVNLAVREMMPGLAYRTLPWSEASGQRECHGGDISPDGRWLAIATNEGVRLWDLGSGKSPTLLPTGRASDAKFHPSGEALYSSGPNGLFRWPLSLEEDGVQLGRSFGFHLDRPLGQLALDGQGNSLAVAGPGRDGGGWVLDLEGPENSPRRLPHVNATFVALSPDGRRLATGAVHGPGVRVWDVPEGKLLRELITDEPAVKVAFSPDSRCLVTQGSGEFRVWDAATWEVVRTVPKDQDADPLGGLAFSPSGRIVAVSLSASVVGLVELATGRLLARLEPPEPDLVWWLGFTPDGRQLAAASQAGRVHLWDLGLIRDQLGQIGLDWQGPPLAHPAATPTSWPNGPDPHVEELSHHGSGLPAEAGPGS